MPELAIGTIVKIIDKKHPAYGQTGRIIEGLKRPNAFPLMSPMYTVELHDMGGHRSMVKPWSLQVLDAK